jgi:hypothetical protein
VWFFSLDAESRAAVWAARTFFHLPYFNARMSIEQRAQTILYTSRRTHRGAAHAEFNATWIIKDSPQPASEPGSLAFFLTERYCLYAAQRESLFRCRIFHPPWPLQEASLSSYRSTMIESLGLTAPGGPPLLHYAEALEVDIWMLAEV